MIDLKQFEKECTEDNTQQALHTLKSYFQKKINPEIYLNGQKIIINAQNIPFDEIDNKKALKNIHTRLGNLWNQADIDKESTEKMLLSQKDTLTSKQKEISKKVGDLLTSCQFKKVYDIGYGQVLTILNIDNYLDRKSAHLWHQVIITEITMSNNLQQLGLLAHPYQLNIASINDQSLPVLISPNFSDMLGEGAQVRDGTKLDHFGHTQIFSHPEIDESYLKSLLKNIMDDIVCLLSNRIALHPNAFNLIIKDKNNANSNGIPTIFSGEQQEIRLYFYNFWNGNDTSLEVLPLMTTNSTLDYEKIAEFSEKYMDYAFRALQNASQNEFNYKMKNKEITNLYNKIKPKLVEEIKYRTGDQLYKKFETDIIIAKYKSEIIEICKKNLEGTKNKFMLFAHHTFQKKGYSGMSNFNVIEMLMTFSKPQKKYRSVEEYVDVVQKIYSNIENSLLSTNLKNDLRNFIDKKKENDLNIPWVSI